MQNQNENHSNPLPSTSITLTKHTNKTSRQKLILALDLDNTLMHSELIEKDGEPLIDISTIDLQNNDDLHVLELGSEKLLVKIRPYVASFLQNMSKRYQLFLCTRGIKVYVDRILEWIDPERIYFPDDRVIPGEALTAPKSVVFKRIVGDYKRVTVLDDTPELWDRQRDKVVFTKPFYYFQEREEALIIRRNVDAFLLLIQEVLDSIHRILTRWPFKKPEISLGDVYKTTIGSLFSKKKFAFFQAYKSNEEMQKSRVYYDLQRFGAKSVALDTTDDTDIIFSKFNNDLNTLNTSNIPVISMLYVNYCEMFGACLEPEIFDLRNKDSMIVNLEKAMSENRSPEQEKLKNTLLDQMEELIIRGWQNRTNNLRHIEDVVINKLKEKYVFRRTKRLDNFIPEHQSINAKAEDESRKRVKKQ